MNGGEISLTSSDDGFNASDGSSSSFGFGLGKTEGELPLLEINGGTVLALGASGMAERFSENSKQVFIDAVLDFNYERGDILLIKDAKGNEIFQYQVKKSGNSVIFSSDQLKDGEKYIITVGDHTTEVTAGLESSLKGGIFGGSGRDTIGGRNTGRGLSGERS